MLITNKMKHKKII